MCTAATYKTKCFYFGRNLDYERGFGEQVVITPRLFPLPMRHLPDLTRHYAMIGMASVQDGYPLYYDAVIEKGLCMAGLNFVRSAVYGPCAPGKANVAQFELIPWLRRAASPTTPFCRGCPRPGCTGCWRTGSSASRWSRRRRVCGSMRTRRAC